MMKYIVTSNFFSQMFSGKDLERAKYLLYDEKVRKLSEQVFKREYLENKDLRGADWHLEHKLSVKECYENGVPIEMAAHICNLEVVPKSYNLQKGRKSSITFSELIEMVTEYEDNII